MENSKMDKELHRALKKEEKNAKRREKRRLQPNAGTGARGYGNFKKERLFPELNKPSSKLPKKSNINQISIINENPAYVVPTYKVEDTSKCYNDYFCFTITKTLLSI